MLGARRRAAQELPQPGPIAATAVARGLTLVTANVREFERVARLEVECWLA